MTRPASTRWQRLRPLRMLVRLHQWHSRRVGRLHRLRRTQLRALRCRNRGTLRHPVLRRRGGFSRDRGHQPSNQGTSLTSAQIGFVIAEPVDGWYNGYVVALNPSSLAGALDRRHELHHVDGREHHLPDQLHRSCVWRVHRGHVQRFHARRLGQQRHGERWVRHSINDLATPH